MLTIESDGDGELLAGLYGCSWCGTCWIEALWVREDTRRRGVGSRLLAAGEEHGRRHGRTQFALDIHTFQARSFYQQHGFEIVGELTDRPKGHSKLLLRMQLPGSSEGNSGACSEKRNARVAPRFAPALSHPTLPPLDQTGTLNHRTT
jgi:hypothetical protein